MCQFRPPRIATGRRVGQIAPQRDQSIFLLIQLRRIPLDERFFFRGSLQDLHIFADPLLILKIAVICALRSAACRSAAASSARLSSTGWSARRRPSDAIPRC